MTCIYIAETKEYLHTADKGNFYSVLKIILDVIQIHPGFFFFG